MYIYTGIYIYIYRLYNKDFFNAGTRKFINLFCFFDLLMFLCVVCMSVGIH